MTEPAHHTTKANSYDVVICGGGLAGLTLARQLRLRSPELSIAVIEQTPRPLPDAAHKVGESSVEVGTHYFGKVLDLEDYFRQYQLPKLGLRYFFGDPHGPFEQRPELGPSLFPPTPSYQIDRGRLENDLRQIVAEMGVAFYEDYGVRDIALADGDAPHEVSCRCRTSGETLIIKGRWVVDALGRRRFLQRKLGLRQPNGHAASAAWWRVEGRVDVSDFVPRCNRRWHGRMVEERYLSTTHLMGQGYWVWLIPLSTGNTSIGIVTDENIHPFQTYGTSFAQALDWLQKHEPAAFAAMKNIEPLDFLGLKDYSYHSRQVFSIQRWSCVGIAGIFADPFYSPGSDFIALGNTITAVMIELDRKGQLTPEIVDLYDHLFLDLIGCGYLHTFRNTYSTFGHCQVFTIKHLWDAAAYWSLWAQFFFQRILERPELVVRFCPLAERWVKLFGRVQQLFIDWAEQAPSRQTYEFMDFSLVPLLRMLNLDLQTSRTPEQFFTVMHENLDRLEELAQVIFFQAVKECCPEQLSRFAAPRWVNAWKVSLHPDEWESDGLFQAESAPRNLGPMTANVKSIFEAPKGWDLFKLKTATALLNMFQGRLVYRLVRWYARAFLHNKPALRTRRWFFRKLFVSTAPVRQEVAQAALPGKQDLPQTEHSPRRAAAPSS